MSANSPESRLLALEQQAAEARAERRAFERQLATFGPIAAQILEAANDLKHLTEDFTELKASNNEDHRRHASQISACSHTVGKLDNSLQQLRTDYNEDAVGRAQERKDLRTARRNFGVAMIGSLGVVLAALIGAIATVLGAH
ncbi:MAG: hypothetical protein QOF51_2347 [Chloroflexota bacterium]|nr:hypothetical protein [Chloroflexota bacterium]